MAPFGALSRSVNPVGLVGDRTHKSQVSSWLAAALTDGTEGCFYSDVRKYNGFQSMHLIRVGPVLRDIRERAVDAEKAVNAENWWWLRGRWLEPSDECSQCDCYLPSANKVRHMLYLVLDTQTCLSPCEFLISP